MLVEEPVINTSEGSPEQGSSANIEQQISWPANEGRVGSQLWRGVPQEPFYLTLIYILFPKQRDLSRGLTSYLISWTYLQFCF